MWLVTEMFKEIENTNVKGSVSTDIGNMELWARG